MPGTTAASFVGLGAGLKAGAKAILPDMPELPSLNIGGETESKIVGEAKTGMRDKLRGRRGVGANILTSPLGITGGLLGRVGSRLLG